MDFDWQGFLSSNNLAGSSGASRGARVASLVSTGLKFTGPVGQVASGFIDTAASISGQFGKGRREADLIVPVQETYGRLLIEVNRQLDAGILDRAHLEDLQILIAGGYAEFDAFTRDPQFTDGRASIQARETIRPLVDGRNDQGNNVRNDGGTLGNIQRAIDARGGGGFYLIEANGGIVAKAAAAPAGGGFTLAGIGGGSDFVAPVRGSVAPVATSNSSLLLVGGAVAAKLAGLW